MDSELKFQEFPKIARLSRDIVVTEKIDGTNGLIYIGPAVAEGYEQTFLVGSRTRWITPETDNFGFAKWCYKHKQELLALGPGYHYGEWWGNGIQRGYGLPNGDKRFSLFNIARWQDAAVRPACCGVVPVLYQGDFSEALINGCLEALKVGGSRAAIFMNPEGIVIFHTAARVYFKKTIVNDEKPKGVN